MSFHVINENEIEMCLTKCLLELRSAQESLSDVNSTVKEMENVTSSIVHGSGEWGSQFMELHACVLKYNEDTLHYLEKLLEWYEGIIQKHETEREINNQEAVTLPPSGLS